MFCGGPHMVKTCWSRILNATAWTDAGSLTLETVRCAYVIAQ